MLDSTGERPQPAHCAKPISELMLPAYSAMATTHKTAPTALENALQHQLTTLSVNHTSTLGLCFLGLLLHAFDNLGMHNSLGMYLCWCQFAAASNFNSSSYHGHQRKTCHYVKCKSELEPKVFQQNCACKTQGAALYMGSIGYKCRCKLDDASPAAKHAISNLTIDLAYINGSVAMPVYASHSMHARQNASRRVMHIALSRPTGSALTLGSNAV